MPHRVRRLPALLVALATALPAAAPLLCGVLRPTMAMASHVDEDAAPGPQLTGHAPSDSCDFGRCGTAPVAPIAKLEAALAVLPLHAVGAPGPGSGLPAPTPPPLTPPPQA